MFFSILPAKRDFCVNFLASWILGISVGTSDCVQQRAVLGLVTTWLAASVLFNHCRSLGAFLCACAVSFCSLLKSFCCRVSKKDVESSGGSISSLPCSSATQQRWLRVSKVFWGNLANFPLPTLWHFTELKRISKEKKNYSLTWFKSTDLLMLF